MFSPKSYWIVSKGDTFLHILGRGMTAFISYDKEDTEQTQFMREPLEAQQSWMAVVWPKGQYCHNMQQDKQH